MTSLRSAGTSTSSHKQAQANQPNIVIKNRNRTWMITDSLGECLMEKQEHPDPKEIHNPRKTTVPSPKALTPLVGD